ncbi:cap-specific mRNA (nucleoside-2'-O-)-methyltransferase 1-like isoform X1 [Sycon ciliatum]|uniref:cap-specific mRNA (nucleoside-2'-O-)-methyltransferase 1-like isoform X1 n=1 Tax=Sycon ciliatum TaxID=27933 RepID=UPI0031F6990B
MSRLSASSSDSSSCDEADAYFTPVSSTTLTPAPGPSSLKRQHDETGTETDESHESPVKKPKVVPSGYSSAAQRMMARMGHQDGEGLGSTIKGIVEPILPEMRMGKRGLGFTLPGFEHTDEDFQEEDAGKDVPATIKEKPEWVESCTVPIPDPEELMSWLLTGPLKLEIEDETHFCPEAPLRSMLASKSAFDRLESNEFLKARTRSNPYELIKNGIFQNRAAMKMANMEKIFDYMFTYPKKPDGSELVGKMDLLYFADICSAPGGFSEYVLWRRRQDMAKGFGFTLKSGPGVNDFKLDDFFSAPVEFFEPHYGVDGVNGDGNIMDSENINAFRSFVLDSTGGHGVHFVMGDGGFSVAGQENIQELLSKQLVLCQFCMAMSILRPGGSFVCKIFDVFTPFTVGLFYLMWLCFDKVALCKPLTSRPANSERYVVCKGLREGTEVIYDYLFILNVRLNEMKAGGQQTEDIHEVVPLDMIKAATGFASYVTSFNETFSKAQINALRRLAAYVRNPDLIVPDQAKIKHDCLLEWKVPDKVRAAPQRKPASDKIAELDAEREVHSFHGSVYNPSDLTSIETLKRSVTSLDDWHCSVCCGQRVLLLGMGRSNVFAFHKDSRNLWIKDSRTAKLVLPANTLIEAEIVEELKGEGKGQRRCPTVYITDALFIYGKDVRQRHHDDRLRHADKMVRALRCLSRSDLMVIRVNHPVKISRVHELFDRLSMRKVKGRAQERLTYQLAGGNGEPFVCPEGMSFSRHIAPPWTRLFSKSQQRPYFCNPNLKKSVFECPTDAHAAYSRYLDSRCSWPWGRDDTRMHYELTKPPSSAAGSSMKASLLEFVAAARSH